MYMCVDNHMTQAFRFLQVKVRLRRSELRRVESDNLWSEFGSVYRLSEACVRKGKSAEHAAMLWKIQRSGHLKSVGCSRCRISRDFKLGNEKASRAGNNKTLFIDRYMDLFP